MVDLFPIVRPLLHRLNPETAHDVTLRALKMGLGPRVGASDDPILAIDLWGRHFPNPIGLAAGFDKNAEVFGPMLRLGFGFVEVGSVTPQPQAGNPKPRLMRWHHREALINRIGFSGHGLDTVERRLASRRANGIVGANIGKNKDSQSAEQDYADGVRRLAPLADYLVINVSSPNTPGLRDLQGAAPLAAILAAAQAARDEASAETPILLKIAPDLTDKDVADIVAVALGSSADGLIVANTTVSRPDDLPGHLAGEAGGLSGPPLMDASTRLLADVARHTAKHLPLIGVGGVASGADAYAKIKSGASLVQLYTALAYRGPRLVTEIKRDLAERIRRDGFACLADAVGSGL